MTRLALGGSTAGIDADVFAVLSASRSARDATWVTSSSDGRSSPLLRDRRPDQVARHLDRAGLDDGWLVMFDLRKERSWAEKLFVREVAHGGKTIRLVGC